MPTDILGRLAGGFAKAWRHGVGIVFNALTGNALARIEASVAQTQVIAEENRRLLRGLHDALQDETLAAHLLARFSERDASQ